jgi:alpha,alpha-trehalose phosphorylase
MIYRGRRLRVDVYPNEARYEVVAGRPLEIFHYGESLTLSRGVPQTLSIPAIQAPEPVRAPYGRSASWKRVAEPVAGGGGA